MLPKVMATATFYGRAEYYDSTFETADFTVTLRDNSDEFGEEYLLDIEWPSYYYQLTFHDKARASRYYLSECESLLGRI